MTISAVESAPRTNSLLVRVFARFEQLMQLSLLERGLSPTVCWTLAMIAVAALQSWLILTHKPWSDEWQALSIAVQSPTFFDLLANLRYEGHPAPWYLFLRTLAGFLPAPHQALPLAALLLAAAGQGCILLAAPFRRSERLLISLSHIFLFEFLTISRSLTLGAVAVLLSLTVWRRHRLSWLALAILPQCDFLFGVIALALAWLRWRERRVWWPGVFILLASGLIAAWTVRPAADIVPALLPNPSLQGLLVWVYRVSTIGLPLQFHDGVPLWNSGPPMQLVPYAWGIMILTSREAFRRQHDHALVMGLYSAITLGFSLLVYELPVRHLLTLVLLFIALAWLRRENTSEPRAPFFRLWLLISAICGLATAAIAAVTPFDTADQAAREIRLRGLSNRQWLAYPQFRAIGIAQMNAMTFQPLGLDCTGNFVRWNFRTKRTGSEIVKQVIDFAKNNRRFYLLTDIAVDDVLPQARRFAVVPPGYDGTGYFLYVINETRPDASVTTKRCTSPVRDFTGPLPL